MVSLRFGFALAAGRAEVSFGVLPVGGIASGTDLPTLVRTEVGAAAPFGLVHGILQVSLFNGDHPSEGEPIVPVDGWIVQTGAGYARPFQWGGFVLTVGADLSLVRYVSPVYADYRAEHEADYGTTVAGFSSWGLSAVANVGVGWEIVPETATLRLAPGPGYATNPGFGLVLPVRLGVDVRF